VFGYAYVINFLCFLRF